MDPGFRLWPPSVARAQPVRLAPRGRQRRKIRTRQLAFEIFEPRLPLAGIPLLPATDMPLIDVPLIEMPATDEPAGCEVAESGGEGSFASPARELPGAGDAVLCEENLCEEEMHADPRRPGINPEESDSSDVAGWNSLDAGPEPNWLFATLEDSPDRLAEDRLAEPLFSLGEERNPVVGSRDDSASDNRWQPGGLSAVADLGTAWRDPQHERREWSGAVTVRYPLAEGGRPARGSGDAVPAQAVASSAGFLDVGCIVTPETGRRLSIRSASSFRTEFPSRSAATAGLATEFGTEGAAEARVGPTASAATSRHRASLMGENRSQRMVLLASAASRLRIREAALMVPYPSLPPETSPTPSPDGRNAEGGDEPGNSDSRRDAVGILHRPTWRGDPPADDRVSRSTMAEIAAFLFLAAGWFRRRQTPERR